VWLVLAIVATVSLLYVAGEAALFAAGMYPAWWGNANTVDFVLNWLWVVAIALWCIWGWGFVRRDDD